MNASRRAFLRSTGGAMAAGVVAGSKAFAQVREPKVDVGTIVVRPPGLPAIIIDTHTHFYDPTRKEGVPWPGKGDAALYKPTLPEHFRKVAVPEGATGTVVVEASPWLEDNQWLLDLAAKDPFLVGIVGNLRPGEENFAEHLARFAKNPLFRGFRINGGGVAMNLQFLPDLTLVAKHDLALDVNGGPSMLPHVARMAAKAPDLRIVINHLANVKNDGKAFDAEWINGMRACAAQKNVFCKVSALAENATRKDAAGLAPKETDYYAPLLDAVWTIWGEDRVIYGSNWPVSARAASYSDVQRVVAEYFGGKGKSVAAKFFAENARVAYKWVKRA